MAQSRVHFIAKEISYLPILLQNRPWVHRHIHVELPVGASAIPSTVSPLTLIPKGLVAAVPRAVAVPQDPAAVTALRNLKDRVQSEIRKYRGGATEPRPQRDPHSSDFARLARKICGKSIGIVLGGGGARGISHLVGLPSWAHSWYTNTEA